MKKAFLLVSILIFTSTFPVLLSQDYDIRKLSWGMSFEDVKRIERLGDDFFKQEELLGIKVEVNFGFDYRGLYSVTYSTRDKDFADKASEVLRSKYGEPKSGLDYSFIMESRVILKQYPEAVVDAYEKGDMEGLKEIKSGDERKLIRNALAKQEVWTYGNTQTLLLNSPDVVKLSYWSNSHQAESKKKFATFLEKLKQKIQDDKKNKKTDDTEKF